MLPLPPHTTCFTVTVCFTVLHLQPSIGHVDFHLSVWFATFTYATIIHQFHTQLGTLFDCSWVSAQNVRHLSSVSHTVRNLVRLFQSLSSEFQLSLEPSMSCTRGAYFSALPPSFALSLVCFSNFFSSEYLRGQTRGKKTCNRWDENPWPSGCCATDMSTRPQESTLECACFSNFFTWMQQWASEKTNYRKRKKKILVSGGIRTYDLWIMCSWYVHQTTGELQKWSSFIFLS